jgi:ABC-type multidrug transport system ATPase subunit
MDEAEQLCDKIAIMINGRFVVFGTPNYLKTQYGHGYTIEIRQEQEKYDAPNTCVKTKVAQLMPSAELVHNSAEDGVVDQPANAQIGVTQQRYVEIRYRVEGINIEGSNVLLSDVFQKLASMSSDGIIKDY